MAAVPNFNPHCVIWFGRPSRREQDLLSAAGWRLRIADPARDVRVGMRGEDQVIGLVDLRCGVAEGLEALERQVNDHADLPLLALTSERTPDEAAAVRRILSACGERLVAPLNTHQLGQALAAFDQTGLAPVEATGLVGQSPPMLEVHAIVHRYSRVDLPVLITGETGTGKELAARALHERSSRHRGPFVAVNCGALPPSLVQAELFGHERGAFTGASARRIGLFESADNGTVFLDEIGDLPMDAQTNLLRVLQEGTLERIGNSHSLRIDVRVLAATHVDLEKAVAEGRFREDLYYRLDVLRLAMPPLRDRGEDVELLARRFLEEFREQHAVTARGFSAAARQALRAHRWPGNVRELLNRVRRAAVIAEQALIGPADLHLGDGHAGGPGLDQRREQAEREAVLSVLRETGYNVSASARRLRVSRVTVYRLCRKHSLTLSELR
ncbi:sigma-54-dependent Fis family transcriptional regulator [Luteimonas sp. SJ-92]|uniref:Sigma-54-dependent Fis family transcriptional regulator n=1 Tax=Luteimonas salinisoli TaxID=2752307 RepID=A0A853J811_9GAMM|nr:sigma-54 dependent transcriptional regulator [Luteimonas salinisoli]NZA25015.1 sigma-54-dependent Fis family transcriptional regulator [Luteimonas salinisoli]